MWWEAPFSWGPYETSPKAFRTSTNSVRPMVDLRTEIAGVRLRNPTMLASGLLDETGSDFARGAPKPDRRGRQGASGHERAAGDRAHPATDARARRPLPAL